MSRKITALRAQKRDPNRINVFLDGEFAFGLKRIVAAWLQVGQELSEEKIAELLSQENQEKAYQQALLFLSYRPRSENEIRRNLRKHKVTEDCAEIVLERLRRNQLVDDLAFSQTWVENRVNYRPRGRRALQVELRQKGIEDAIIQQALSSINEDDLAYQAACKQQHKYRSMDWPTFRRKLSAFLARRGFSYQNISPVVERVWAERDVESTVVQNEIDEDNNELTNNFD